jgi:hypothetical protein
MALRFHVEARNVERQNVETIPENAVLTSPLQIAAQVLGESHVL